MSQTQARHIALARGEDNIHSVQVRPSLLFFWLKTDMTVTNQRISWRSPNTLLAVIPLGYEQAAFPLQNTASIAATARFSLGRAIWGFFWTMVGIGTVSSGGAGAVILGLVIMYLGVGLLLNSWRISVDVTNNGGGFTQVFVSFVDRKIVEEFAREAQDRLFTNYDGLRHQETVGYAQAQLYTQQAQLNAQMQFLAAAGLAGQPQDPRAVTQSQPASLPVNNAQTPPSETGPTGNA